jgi:hypothetical protein
LKAPEASLGSTEVKGPLALLKYSKEALSLIAQNERSHNWENIQQRVERVLKEIRYRHDKQIEVERQIVRELNRQLRMVPAAF